MILGLSVGNEERMVSVRDFAERKPLLMNSVKFCYLYVLAGSFQQMF